MNPFDESYFGLPGWLLVLFIWLIGFSGFGYQVYIAFRLIKLGGPDNRFNNWGLRAKEFFRGWLGQSKVLRDPVIGPLHAMIFWGFLCLSTDMFDLSSGGRFEKLLAFIHPFIANFWNLTVDMGYLVAGIGAFGALIRRVIIRPAKLKPSLEANLILVTILTIVVTSFIVEAGEKPSNWEPIGVLFAGSTAGLSTSTFEGLVIGSYWLHMILLSGFLIAQSIKMNESVSGHTILSFLEKRLFRILPASLTILAIVGIVSNWVLFPEEKIELNEVSNDYFFEEDLIFKLSFYKMIIKEIPIETIYFDNQSSLNPFAVILPFLFRHFKNYTIRLKNEYFNKK